MEALMSPELRAKIVAIEGRAWRPKLSLAVSDGLIVKEWEDRRREAQAAAKRIAAVLVRRN
jgi:hypothetical protein